MTRFVGGFEALGVLSVGGLWNSNPFLCPSVCFSLESKPYINIMCFYYTNFQYGLHQSTCTWTQYAYLCFLISIKLRRWKINNCYEIQSCCYLNRIFPYLYYTISISSSAFLHLCNMSYQCTRVTCTYYSIILTFTILS